MPDLGIGEALTAAGGGGLFDSLLGGLGSLFGIGGAEAAGGAAAAAGAGGGLADLVGTGAGLFGGTTGLEGTLLAGGAGGLGDVLGASAAGLGAAGTAADFLAAPGASGLGGGAALSGGIGSGALGTGAAASGADAAAAQAASSGLATGVGDIAATPSITDLIPGGGPGALGAATPAPQPTGVGGVSSSSGPGSSVFNTGAAPVTGVNSAGSAAPITTNAIPSGTGGAASIAGPSGLTAPADATSAGVAAAGGAAPAAGSSSSISSLLSRAGSGAINSLTSNPIGTALGAAGLGYNILQGQHQTANQNQLSQTAAADQANSAQMVQSGEALQQYLTSGTLPAAYQQQVDQAIQDAKTTAISNAAQQGQPTDPTQNTALAATLARIDSSRAGMQAQVASQLFSSGSSLVGSGLQAAGLSGNLYQALVNNDTTAARNTGQAIATLAAALNGKAQNTIGNTTVTAQAA